MSSYYYPTNVTTIAATDIQTLPLWDGTTFWAILITFTIVMFIIFFVTLIAVISYRFEYKNEIEKRFRENDVNMIK